MVIRPV